MSPDSARLGGPTQEATQRRLFTAAPSDVPTDFATAMHVSVRLLHSPLTHERNRVSCGHSGGHRPCRSLARDAGYCTKAKKPGFLPTSQQPYMFQATWLTEPYYHGKIPLHSSHHTSQEPHSERYAATCLAFEEDG